MALAIATPDPRTAYDVIDPADMRPRRQARIVTAEMSTKAKARTNIRAFDRSGSSGRPIRPLRAALPAAPGPQDPSAALPRSCARPRPRCRRHRRWLRRNRSTARYRVLARRLRRIFAGNEPVPRADLPGRSMKSAISRSETTGFLSLSRSTVSCDPDEIIRARCAASRTRSNRLSTLSMQSSTVTRAMNCRSVVWGPICWLSGVVIAVNGLPQGQICDLPSPWALLPQPGPAGRNVPDIAKCRPGQANLMIVSSKD